MASAIQASKQALRSAINMRLRALTDAEVQEQSDAVIRNVLTSPTFQDSRSVACFLSMKGEVNTHGLARQILQLGKTLYVPKILSKKEKKMDMIRIYGLEDLESLPSGLWGIREPGPTWEGRQRASALLDAVPIDLVLIPGVAFDQELSRIGHGKGYYDTFINKYFGQCAELGLAKPHLSALALREQIVPVGQIPMAEHDRKVDDIFTADSSISV